MSLELYRSEAGKPFVTKESRGQSAITFNMSHAHGRALIAVSKGQEVGVDLERIRSDVEVEKLSERYFAPSEHATIMQSAQEQRAAEILPLLGRERGGAQGARYRTPGVESVRDLLGSGRSRRGGSGPGGLSAPRQLEGSFPFL